MTDEKRGFVFHTPEGDMDLTIYEVKELVGRDDPDGLYALGMAYLYRLGYRRPDVPTMPSSAPGGTCSPDTTRWRTI